MSAITFGSVGDIIAVGQIAVDLAQALSNTRGSAKDYQGLVGELQAFDKALLQVVTLWQNYEDGPELQELGTTTKDIVHNYRQILLEFRLNIDEKYGTSLVLGGSGNWFKDVAKKGLWLGEKEDVLELRRKLSTGTNAIIMLALAAMGNSNKLVSTRQDLRSRLVNSLLEESVGRAEEQMIQLKLIEAKLDSQTRRSELMLAKVQQNMVSLAQVPTIILEMRTLLLTLQEHVSSLQANPRGLGAHWQQAPVTLEDALGRTFPIPLESFNSWEMLDMFITNHFETHPGSKKIKRGEYALEDSITGKELSRSCDWTHCFRPGLKVDMSVIFKEEFAGNNCPRCHTLSRVSSDVRTQCTNPSCNMVFQRFEVSEEDAPISQQADGTSSEIDQPTAGSPRGKQERDAGIELQPSDFRRVRLMRKSYVTASIPSHSSSIFVPLSTTSESNTLNQNMMGAWPGDTVSIPSHYSSIFVPLSTTSESNTLNQNMMGAWPGYTAFVGTFDGKVGPIVRCDIQECSKTFTRLQDMKRHKHEFHTGTIKCPLCDYVTKREYTLHAHMGKLHLININSILAENPPRTLS